MEINVKNFNPKFKNEVLVNSNFYGDIITELNSELLKICQLHGIEFGRISDSEFLKYNLKGNLNKYVRVYRFGNEIDRILKNINRKFFFDELNEELDRVEYHLRHTDEEILSKDIHLRDLYFVKDDLIINISSGEIKPIIKFVIHQSYLKFVYRFCLELEIENNLFDW